MMGEIARTESGPAQVKQRLDANDEAVGTRKTARGQCRMLEKRNGTANAVTPMPQSQTRLRAVFREGSVRFCSATAPAFPLVVRSLRQTGEARL
jgi:hypothetical protein